MSKKQIILFDLKIFHLLILAIIFSGVIPAAIVLLLGNSELANYSAVIFCAVYLICLYGWIKISRGIYVGYLRKKLDGYAFHDLCMNSLFFRYVYSIEAYFYSGRYQEAVNASVESIRKSRKADLRNYNVLSCIYFILGDYGKIAELSKWAPKPKKPNGSVGFMTYFLDGNYQNAKQALFEALESKPSELNASFYDFCLGIVCNKLEQYDEARTYFRLIADNYPKLGIAKQAEEQLTALEIGLPLPEYPEMVPDDTKYISKGKLKAYAVVFSIIAISTIVLSNLLMNSILLVYYFIKF